ncbi:ABC-type uncharacterized transport system, substrate-binding protein [Cribrihabitans marinus]|uniref:ABC-type uncharacterized transport system, substrate-binding protein n=2 Tax=Cribrihabitans marinus TaxID=1227549 RepID=A0A1H7BHB4_9RHOB|nr:ABC-type uncharacterized transport system, substrate-binding protein [Cribrihabitans marinus]
MAVLVDPRAGAGPPHPVIAIAAPGRRGYLAVMRRLLILLSCLLPFSAVAHPHVFVDTGFRVIYDAQNRLTHVEVTWAYDDFYSLLILEDSGLDSDGDGVLTPEEQTELTGFDMNWAQGFEGDFYLELDGRPLPLSGPREPTAEVQDGRIVTTHLRAVETPVATGGDVLTARAYDPSYYTAYELNRPVTVESTAACLVERIDPDIDGKLAQMQAMLLRIDADADLEENDIPLVGEEFATEIRVSCPVS